MGSRGRKPPKVVAEVGLFGAVGTCTLCYKETSQILLHFEMNTHISLTLTIKATRTKGVISKLLTIWLMSVRIG